MAGSGRDKGVNGSGHPAHLRFAANKGRGTDELRSQMDEAEHGHVVFRSVFPTHLSDAFQEHRSEFFRADPEGKPEIEREVAPRGCAGFRGGTLGTGLAGPQGAPKAPEFREATLLERCRPSRRDS